jgi:hypothetical protein
MIKLKDLITELVSKSVVKNLMLNKNAKVIEAEYVFRSGKKEKEKFKVKKTYETDNFYMIVVGRDRPRAKEHNNFEFVIDKNKLTIRFRAKMGMMTNQLSDKILSLKMR